MHSVLIVDDDPDLRTTIRAWVDSFGYDAREAGSAEAALAHLDRQPSDITLCDVTMAGKDGVWLAWRIREQFPKTAIVMASLVRDVETAVCSLRNNVVDYLLKPFDRVRLCEALSLARDWHAAAQGDEDLHQVLQDRLRSRRASLAAVLAEAQTTHEAALDGLISMLQFHERDGRGHSRRVARLTLAIAEELGATDERTLAELEHGALLHDIGKLEVPTVILNKSAPLDEAEWTVMRTHPRAGYDLLRNLPKFSGASELVLAHHEAFDGSGYPRGLEGKEIPLGARILAIADSYDSMTHPHTQRPPMMPAMAIREVERCSGSQFDPVVAEALGNVLIHAAEEPSHASV